MVDVSVIIPVYNTEEYLEECLQSIVNQTLKDIEIICINDGSTDCSPKILKEYEENDSRIIVLSQENKGQGNARNRAISHATGKYVYFMDSDDKIELNTLNDSFQIAEEKNLDFVMFKLINYDQSNGNLFESDYYNMTALDEFVGDRVFSSSEIGGLIFSMAVSPVNKLYNREFLLSTGARFPENLIFEDNIFFWDFIFEAERIYFIKEYFYIRRMHNASTLGSRGKSTVDTIKINNLIFDKFRKEGLFDEYRNILYNKKVGIIEYRYRTIQDEYKEYFYNLLVDDFNSMCESEDYDSIADCLEPINRKFFDDMLLSSDFNDFVLKNENALDNGNDSSADESDNNEKTHQTSSSKSSKIKKPLRAFKRFFNRD